MRLALVAVLITACTTASPPTSSSPPSPTSSSGGVVAPGTSSPTQTASALDDITLLQRHWAPSRPTAIVATYNLSDTTIVAVPLDGTTSTELVSVKRHLGDVPSLWDVRRDGSALVIGVKVGITASRLAIVDLARATKAWLTTTAQELTTPTWSYDGRSVLYGSYTPAAGDDGITRVTVDGTVVGKARQPSTAFASLSSVGFETQDGVLVGADEFNGPTAFVHELGSGRERSFGVHYSRVEAWHVQRPRALVSVYTSIAAPGAGYLALWDDIDGTVTTILNRPVSGADFEPGGGHIVAAAIESGTSQLALLPGPLVKAISGSEGASWPRWTMQGIVYDVNQPQGSELRLVVLEGSTTVLLRSAGQLSPAKIVSP